jgi:hypothetical protein
MTATTELPRILARRSMAAMEIPMIFLMQGSPGARTTDPRPGRAPVRAISATENERSLFFCFSPTRLARSANYAGTKTASPWKNRCGDTDLISSLTPPVGQATNERH